MTATRVHCETVDGTGSANCACWSCQSPVGGNPEFCPHCGCVLDAKRHKIPWWIALAVVAGGIYSPALVVLCTTHGYSGGLDLLGFVMWPLLPLGALSAIPNGVLCFPVFGAAYIGSLLIARQGRIALIATGIAVSVLSVIEALFFYALFSSMSV